MAKKTTTKKTTEKKPVKTVTMADLAAMLNTQHDMVAAVMSKLDKIERLLSTPQDVTSGTVTFNPIITEEQGLEPGDYTDASKEVADALTAMGWAWVDGDRFNLPIITWHSDPKYALYGKLVCTTGNQDNPLPHPEFLSRAAVTAKAIGLVAVVKEEEWPKAGDLAVVTSNHGGGYAANVEVGDVLPVQRIDASGDAWFELQKGQEFCFTPRKRLRKPTPQEEAKYHADIEAAKPIVPYVTRVVHNGKEWRVIRNANKNGRYQIHRVDEYETSWSDFVKRVDFTIIDP